MNYFLKHIHDNQLYHLHKFDIPIADEKTPHLMLTGKNGSGKTVLLNAIASFLDNIKNDKSLGFTKYREHLEYNRNKLSREMQDAQKLMQTKNNINFYQSQIDKVFGQIELDFVDVANMIEDYQKEDFIIAFYQAARKTQMIEPKNPTKPELKGKGDVRSTVTNQFLNFLSDLKIQEALARNEQQFNGQHKGQINDKHPLTRTQNPAYRPAVFLVYESEKEYKTRQDIFYREYPQDSGTRAYRSMACIEEFCPCGTHNSQAFSR